MKKYDSLSTGIIIGLILPVISIVTYYFIKFYPSFGFSDFLEYAKKNTPALTPLIGISLLVNTVIFTLFINTNRYRSGKGVFWATVIYGITTFIFKLLA